MDDADEARMGGMKVIHSERRTAVRAQSGFGLFADRRCGASFEILLELPLLCSALREGECVAGEGGRLGMGCERR